MHVMTNWLRTNLLRGLKTTNLLPICNKLTMAKKMTACTFYQNASRALSKNDGKKDAKGNSCEDRKL